MKKEIKALSSGTWSISKESVTVSPSPPLEEMNYSSPEAEQQALCIKE